MPSNRRKNGVRLPSILPIVYAGYPFNRAVSSVRVVEENDALILQCSAKLRDERKTVLLTGGYLRIEND